MTYLDLCQRLRQEVGAAGDGPAAVTGQHGEYKRFIDWVRQEWIGIQTTYPDWRFAWAEGMIEMEDEFRDYSLPGDFGAFIEGTIFMDDRPITLLPYRVFRQRFRNASPTTPRYITVTPVDVLRLNSKVQIDAAPGQGQKLWFEYYRSPQVLQGNTDIPRLPTEYHMLIVYQAMVQYGMYENAAEVVQQGASNVARLMNDMLRSELPTIRTPGALA